MCYRDSKIVQEELTISTDRGVTAVPVPRAIEELMESVKIGNRDECARGTHECPDGANCIKRLGSYSCTCPKV